MFAVCGVCILQPFQIDHGQNQRAWSRSQLADGRVVQTIQRVRSMCVREGVGNVIGQRHRNSCSSIVQRLFDAIQEVTMRDKLHNVDRKTNEMKKQNFNFQYPKNVAAAGRNIVLFYQ